MNSVVGHIVDAPLQTDSGEKESTLYALATTDVKHCSIL